MIAKAKAISHGANAIRYSVDKDKAEIVKTNLLPDDISPTAMWARMLALQKKFEDKLNRYHPLKRNMIRVEVSPTSEETQGWTIEDWQKLADDFIREFDAVDLSAKSKRKSAKATNLKDSQYVVALHRDSKSGIMHLHIDANRIDMRGNVNDAHYIYERAMAAAAKVGQQRGWKDAQEVSCQNKEAITNDCLSVLTKMPYFDWGLYTKCLTQMGYDVKLQSDNVFAKMGDVQKTAILLFAEYIDAATTIAAQSGGGGVGATSGWGRDKDEDELSWAYRCAMMANRLCRPRKKQGYGR